MRITSQQQRMLDTALSIRDRQFENEIERLQGEVKLKDIQIKHLEERLAWYAGLETKKSMIILETN